ncbi:LysR family transcriptional regulator [Achromobacter sp. 413638]|uniref:LysR family transcriptional regulator n=1 Tax=Achromobacter sp. 413638 TaxID=3342385 RepID=UPI00370C8452
MHGIALRYFVEVAQAGSLSGASERLHVAVSAISRQIAKLEEQAGAPLFERAARGMVLSDAGRLLLTHARRTMLESESVLQEIAALKGAARDEIRVASVAGVARTFLPAAMARFRQDWPDMRFDLHVDTPREVLRRVAEGQAELGMAFNMERAGGLSVRYSRRAPVHAVMAADHPLAGRASVSLQDLGAYPMALTEPGTTTRRLFELGCALESVQIEPALSCNDPSPLHGFVYGSDAIMLGAYISVTHSLDRDQLVAVPISNAELQSRSLQIQVMQGRLLPPKTEAFIALLCRQLDELLADRPKARAQGAAK